MFSGDPELFLESRAPRLNAWKYWATKSKVTRWSLGQPVLIFMTQCTTLGP